MNECGRGRSHARRSSAGSRRRRTFLIRVGPPTSDGMTALTAARAGPVSLDFTLDVRRVAEVLAGIEPRRRCDG